MDLPSDLQDLVAEVISQIPRLLSIQDKDPDSPMRGCMHQAYWRDKSSDVADMRRQEAALAFAWVWRHEFPDNPYVGNDQVLNASLRALGFWTREQHRDGTFDEWYKNEHGYATTAFSSYAVSLAVEALGEELNGALLHEVMKALRKCGEWLSTHDDWFKTNHEAVGIAALGAIGRVTGERSFLDAAHRNAGLIVDRMHAEGWSKEISGFDVGYSFLLAEYMGMHAVLTGERTFLPAIGRAFRFATWFLHPDLTTGAEYGICANPYFSRVAAVVLAPHDAIASGVLEWMHRPAPDGVLRDTSSTLKDDLRLARYAYQPLLAALLYAGVFQRKDLAAAKVGASNPLFLAKRSEQWFPDAKLCAIARPSYAAWAAPVHGGFLRVAFRDGAGGFLAAAGDRGYAVQIDRGVWRSARWSQDVEASFDPATGLKTEAPLVKAGFVMPPYWARVGLRAATSMPAGHRWSRWLIDQYRKRKGTALNQSAAGVSKGKSQFTLERHFEFEDDRIVVRDTLRPKRGGIDLEKTFLVLDYPLRAELGLKPDPDRRIPLSALNPRVEPSGVVKLDREIRRDGKNTITRCL